MEKRAGHAENTKRQPVIKIRTCEREREREREREKDFFLLLFSLVSVRCVVGCARAILFGSECMRNEMAKVVTSKLTLRK